MMATGGHSGVIDCVGHEGTGYIQTGDAGPVVDSDSIRSSQQMMMR